MSDNQQTVPAASKEEQLKAVEQVRDLFARAHDYIAQAQYPGHMGMKIAEVQNFLAFQHNDFKLRGENLAKVIEAEAKAELSKVDVAAAQEAVAATLTPDQKTNAVETQVVEAPKAQ